MAITAAEINQLRKQTGAGMMDCKKALTEADGDFEKATDLLRKQGQKVAAKRADRNACEGYATATISSDGKKGITTSLNCETDFVSQNSDFIALAQSINDLAVSNNASSLDELNALPMGGMTVAEKIIEQTGIIGEKLEVQFQSVEAEKVGAYIHPGNRIVTLVGANRNDIDDDVLKGVAMQVAAMNPIALNQAAVDQATIDREIEVGKDLAIQEGKPADMADKIAMGRLNKFFKENTLLAQTYIKADDGKQSVEQYLKSVNPDLEIVAFKRFSLAN